MQKATRVVIIVVLVLIAGNLGYYASKADDPTDARVLSALQILTIGGLALVLYRRRRADTKV